MNSKMYVLVRKDLPKHWYGVQACHAVAEYILTHPLKQWDNGVMVLLQVEDQDELLNWYSKLLEDNIEASVFKESYIKKNPFTALATIVYEDQYPLFEDLKLL